MASGNRYPHISALLLGLAVSLFSFRLIGADKPDIYFLAGLPVIIKVLPAVLAFGAMTFVFIPTIPEKVKTYIIGGLWALFLLCATDFLFVPVLNSFDRVRRIERIPDRSRFLDSVMFIIIRHWADFMKGLGMTMALSLVGTVLGLMLGLILVYILMLEPRVRDGETMAFFKRIGRGFTKMYVNIFRGTPMMVQAVVIYYAAPAALAAILNVPQERVDAVFTILVAGIVVVTLNTAAYLTEVLRGGIEAVDKGQLEAAQSQGLSRFRAMRHIILPQGIKNALPAICNEFLINIKDTSVLNVIGVAELFFMAQDAKYIYYRSYEPFIIAGIIYLVVTLSVSRVILFIEKKMNLETKEIPSCN